MSPATGAMVELVTAMVGCNGGRRYAAAVGNAEVIVPTTAVAADQASMPESQSYQPVVDKVPVENRASQASAVAPEIPEQHSQDCIIVYMYTCIPNF